MFLEYLDLSAIGKKKAQLKVSVVANFFDKVVSDGILLPVSFSLCKIQKTDQMLVLWSLHKSHTF